MITLKKKHRGYDKYHASGLEWLGHVPGGWDLGRIAYYFTERREKVSDLDYPALSVTKEGIVPQIDSAAKSDDGENRKKVCIGDFVINSRSDRKGSSGMSSLEGSVSLICTVLHPREKVHHYFIHYLFRSQGFQEEYYRNGKGIVADLWSTNYSVMKNIVIALPPFSEQVSIATLLNEKCALIDRILEEKKRQIGILEEQRSAIINRAVTKGLDEEEAKESGVEWIGEIPKSWSVLPLKINAPFISRGNSPDYADLDNGIPVINQACVHWEGINVGNVKYQKFADISEWKGLLMKNDILINSTGTGTLGRVALFSEKGTYLADGHVTIVRTSAEVLDPRFLKYIFQTEIYQGYIYAALVTGSTNQIELSRDGLRNMPVVVPPIEIQKKISSYLDTKSKGITQLLTKINASIDLLNEYKTSLISHVVTGKVKVSFDS